MNIRYDVFGANRLRGATFTEPHEFPRIKPVFIDSIPGRIVGFDKLTAKTAIGALSHFYVQDRRYPRLYYRPTATLAILKSTAMVLGLDHSTYRDLPLTEQQHSVYLNRASDYWLQREGVTVIPNVGYGDERSYAFCCEGIEKGSSIAVSSAGNKRRRVDITYFIEGFRFVVNYLHPHSVIVHGNIHPEIREIAAYYGVLLLQIPTRISEVHRRKVA